MQAKLGEHCQAIVRAESEITRLKTQMEKRSLSAMETKLLGQEMKTLRDRNLMDMLLMLS